MNDLALIPLSEISWNLIYDGLEVVSAKTGRIGTVDLGLACAVNDHYSSCVPRRLLDEDEKDFLAIRWHRPGYHFSIQAKCNLHAVFRASEEALMKRRLEEEREGNWD